MKIKYNRRISFCRLMEKAMVVDTGAARTLIFQDAVEDIGIQIDSHDRMVTYFGVVEKNILMILGMKILTDYLDWIC